MIKENLVDLFSDSFKKNWEKEAVKDYVSKRELTYGEYAVEIEKLHIFFKEVGIGETDTIAVCGKNSIAWSLVYMSVVTYGAVIVPILDEFNPKDITHILNHSEAKMIFCDDDIWEKMDSRDFDKLFGVISLNNNQIITSCECYNLKNIQARSLALYEEKYADGFKPEHINYKVREANSLAVICYTSGTTSLTKGVMLSLNNLCGNTIFARDNYINLGVELKSTLCILPLAHTYGAAFNLLAQFVCGTKVTFLGKVPSPSYVLNACKEAKPTLLFLVPLVLEKIYKSNIHPVINKPIVASLLKIPFLGDLICKFIGKKIYRVLGGELEEVIIGGAAMNKEVEAFFSRAKFPFLIGYGMTECAPLISYIHHKHFIPTSVGKSLDNLMDVRIVKESEHDEMGEIQTRGENVMLGYYKDEEATKATLTEDGWLKTGDLGSIDENGNIFIKGRSKTMLLGPSGENIYPESIESQLANMPFVLDSIVLQKNGRLEAWVHPDLEEAKKMDISEDELCEVMNDNRKSLNLLLAKFEAITAIRISKEPFPKTPKRTIKRMDTLKMVEELY